ncbi:hypothetical protein ACWDN6_15360 [Streptomyces albogriseolus]|uniref:hypothetical protein n=1 Tax=Streptomyces albogriseolus group TaxID=2867120 RepID=UPI001873F029|nr:hypothetical protein GCM10010332_67360 [Streptomyces albogriseolus]
MAPSQYGSHMPARSDERAAVRRLVAEQLGQMWVVWRRRRSLDRLRWMRQALRPQ